MKAHTCRDCGSEFTHSTGKPGRPPVRCPECREKVKQFTEQVIRSRTTLSPEERVIRLEANLKSRGLHPSQNQER